MVYSVVCTIKGKLNEGFRVISGSCCIIWNMSVASVKYKHSLRALGLELAGTTV